MKLTVDPEADALYLRLNDAKIIDSEQVASGVILDFDAQDNVVGIEMLHLSRRARKADLQRLFFETLGVSARRNFSYAKRLPITGRKAPIKSESVQTKRARSARSFVLLSNVRSP
jgi:uncharacterized protein YuzE